MARADGIPWWEKWGYVTRCPKCNSKRVESLEKFRYTFTKNKREQEFYKCLICGEKFWSD